MLHSPDHLDSEHSPLKIASQTDWVVSYLRKVKDGPIDHAQDYIAEYTFPYLSDAAESSDVLFDDEFLKSAVLDPDGEMAARHVYVVLACMPDMVTHPNLSRGFSRGGILRAPSNKEEFVGRIKEIEKEVGQIAFDPDTAHSSNINIGRWRALRFFETASLLTNLHVPEIEDRESAEREREALAKLKELRKINS